MIGRGRNLSRARELITLEVRGQQVSRLDVYLRENLAWRSRNKIQRLIRGGYVNVNGKSGKPSQLVRPGDRIEVRLSLGTGLPDYEEQPLDIVYEDPWLVALNKPPGLLVHPVGRHVYDTLINYLHHRYRDQMGPDRVTHPRLCHRIDRDTTGVLLVGKERHVHLEVQGQLERREVSKMYLALAEGEVPDTLEEIDRPIREGEDLATALEGPGLKASRTRIEVRERFWHAGRPYTWLAARPVTGRQNQIRVHLGSVGHPLVGDERYGGQPSPAEFPQRFLLHARKFRFHHPRLKVHLEVRAELPDDLANLIETLRIGGGSGNPGSLAADSRPS